MKYMHGRWKSRIQTLKEKQFVSNIYRWIIIKKIIVVAELSWLSPRAADVENDVLAAEVLVHDNSAGQTKNVLDLINTTAC